MVTAFVYTHVNTEETKKQPQTGLEFRSERHQCKNKVKIATGSLRSSFETADKFIPGFELTNRIKGIWKNDGM